MVDAVDLQITEGKGTISGVSVGSPAGFAAERAFAFDRVTVELDPDALTRVPIVVRRVTVDRCDVTYEWQLHGSNMSRLQENVREYLAGERTIREAAGGDEPSRVVIEELVISGGTIDLTASALGSAVVALPLDRIVLHDVGKKEGGATAGEITAELVRALTRRVIEAVANSGVDVLDDARKTGEKILEGAKDILDGARGD